MCCGIGMFILDMDFFPILARTLDSVSNNNKKSRITFFISQNFNKIDFFTGVEKFEPIDKDSKYFLPKKLSISF
jgi:hypothetical protein